MAARPRSGSGAITSKRSPKRCTSVMVFLRSTSSARISSALPRSEVRTSSRVACRFCAQFFGRADLVNLAQVHQRDAMAAFGFIEIRSRDQNGKAVGGKMRQRVPEFAARDGIDTGGRFVQQQNLGLRDQRAGQRELLLHAAA